MNFTCKVNHVDMIIINEFSVETWITKSLFAHSNCDTVCFVDTAPFKMPPVLSNLRPSLNESFIISVDEAARVKKGVCFFGQFLEKELK